MSTPLTAEQYSELVVALEQLREGCRADDIWYDDDMLKVALRAWCGPLSAFAYIYLVQWFHRIGPIRSQQALRYACAHMVAELCEELCR